MEARMNEVKVRFSGKKYFEMGFGDSVEEARERIKYWKTLTDNERMGYTAAAEINGEDSITTEALAIAEAWRQSPMEVAKREAKEASHQNEILTCNRTGEQVARKDAIVVGDSVFAKSALSKEEAEFLGIKIETTETKETETTETTTEEPSDNTKAAMNFVHTGRRVVPKNWDAFKVRYNVA